MDRENLAYDFARFEPRKTENKNNVIPMPKQKKEPVKKSRISFGTLCKKGFTAMVIVAFAMIMIHGYVTTNELTNSIAAQEKKLAEAQSEYTQLQNARSSKYNLDYVEDYAKNVLGMQKMQRNQVEYVQMNEADKIEVLADNDGGLWSVIKDFFAGLF